MITVPELVMLAAAGYRATQLAVHDTILDPLRDRLADRHAAALMADKPARALTFLVALTSCVYCMGWWIAGALLATYLLVTGQFHGAPLLVHGIEWLAVAGGAVLANRWDDSRKDGAA